MITVLACIGFFVSFCLALLFVFSLGRAAAIGDAQILNAYIEESKRLASIPCGLPTDSMINDMCIEDELEHEAYMRAHHTFTMVVICPCCGQRMMHGVSQYDYVELCFCDKDAIQDAITEEDGHVYSTVYLSRFCSSDCVEACTQGASLDIDWYPCRDPRRWYVCNEIDCTHPTCAIKLGYDGEMDSPEPRESPCESCVLRSEECYTRCRAPR